MWVFAAAHDSWKLHSTGEITQSGKFRRLPDGHGLIPGKMRAKREREGGRQADADKVRDGEKRIRIGLQLILLFLFGFVF
jgi:hypothetical protein